MDAVCMMITALIFEAPPRIAIIAHVRAHERAAAKGCAPQIHNVHKIAFLGVAPAAADILDEIVEAVVKVDVAREPLYAATTEATISFGTEIVSGVISDHDVFYFAQHDAKSAVDARLGCAAKVAELDALGMEGSA